MRDITDRPNRGRAAFSFAISTPSTLDNVLTSQPAINITNLLNTTIKDGVEDSNQHTEPEPDDSDDDPGNIELNQQSVKNGQSFKLKW